MIINLNIHDKKVIVIGGGKEAEKRITTLLKQDAKILVLSPDVTNKIKKLAIMKKIQIKNDTIKNTSFLTKHKPDIIITTTDNSKLNQKILQAAKKKKILAYSSDDPDSSDFSNPAIIDFEKTIQVAIFTGGKSPAMSKKLKTDAEKIFRKIIKKEDLAQIKIQQIARHEAKKSIPSQIHRKRTLKTIMADKTIKQLIKDGQLKKAENRAISMVMKENES